MDVLSAWLDDGQVIRILKEKLKGQVRLVKLFVSDGCYESIRQLEKSVNLLNNAIPHVVILNEGRVSAADFSYLDQEDLYTQLRSAPNFIDVVHLPALEPGTRFFVDRYGQGLRKAYEKCDADSKFLVAHRIESFINDVNAMFQRVDASIDEWFADQPDWSGNGQAHAPNESSADELEADSDTEADAMDSEQSDGRKKNTGPMPVGA